MGTDLKDRLDAAMKRRNKTVRELVETTGLSKSAIHFLLDGTTRPETVRAWNIDLLCKALEVDREWLLYGTGHMNRQEPMKVGEGEAGYQSQLPALDPAILSRAEFWVRVEERAGVKYPDLRRAERIIDLYQMIQADGGTDLTAEHAIALVQAAQGQSGGGTSGRTTKAAGNGK